MNKFRITHAYCALNNNDFYGVETSMSQHQVNNVIAYMQLLYHFNIPEFLFTEDSLGQFETVVLMARLYDAKPIFDKGIVHGEIDLYKIWDTHRQNIINTYPLMVSTARPGVFHAILQHIANITARAMPMYKEKYPELFCSAVRELPRIRQILEGKPVNPEWGWMTASQDPCDAFDYSRKRTPDLLEWIHL